MARFLKSRKSSHGTSPGSLIFIGNKKMEKSEIHLTIYNKDSLLKNKLMNLDEIPDNCPEDTVMWINIYGLQDTDLIAKIGERFNIPPLELEDILNTDQRPKLSENENNLTIFLKVLEYKEESQGFQATIFPWYIGSNYVITFQESVGRYFEPVRERIRNSRGRIRKSGPDYLAYALIDTLVDGYIQSIESLGHLLKKWKKKFLQKPKKKLFTKFTG